MSKSSEPEIWSNETIAEFMLNNALSPDSYREAVQDALAMGVNPLELNPAHLIQDEHWARPELYIESFPRQKHP